MKIMLTLIACFFLMVVGVYYYDCKPDLFRLARSWTFIFLAPSALVCLLLLPTKHYCAAIGASFGAMIVTLQFAGLVCSEYEGGGAAMLEPILSVVSFVASIAMAALFCFFCSALLKQFSK